MEPESALAAFSRGEYNVFRPLKRRKNQMTTMTVRMSDEDAELVRKYVGFEGTTISEFARNAMLEKIEDHADLQELRAAIEADDGQRFSISDVLEELD
ncbi:CopG family transcriptional regulator [Corynebacterium striatum]|uniref:CopG family transcriptional regulator n=2 Tax=Corynebacterium striatum TaxID=43770 RepID=A0A2Z2J4B3_CORST|nr:CopG family transcriptional regulator [Corynebacterium striatum]